jgi:hypothetical protein
VLSLDGRWPVFLIQSIVRSDGKIGDDIIAIKDKLCGILNECGFPCVVLATDGDHGMDKTHLAMFRWSANRDGCLALIARDIIRDQDKVLPVPTSDLSHLMRNTRSRLALGKLAFIGFKGDYR